MKTAAQRVRESEDRKRAQGLRKVWVWAHPDDMDAIRQLAQELRNKRQGK